MRPRNSNSIFVPTRDGIEASREASRPPRAGTVIECYGPRWNWLCVVFFGAMGCLTLDVAFGGITPPQPDFCSQLTLDAFVVFGVTVFWGAGAACAVMLLCWRIFADEDGLHWRNFRLWRHATWDEVEDFSLIKKGSRSGQIVTTHGKISISPSWVNGDRLMQFVQRRALGGNQVWMVPPRKVYQGPSVIFRVNMVPMSLVTLVFTVLAFGIAIGGLRFCLGRARQFQGFVPAWIGGVLWVFIVGVCFFMAFIYLVLAWPRFLASWARRAQTVTISDDGIQIWDGAAFKSTTWVGIHRCSIFPAPNLFQLLRLKVEFDGGEFTLLPDIFGFFPVPGLFRAITRRLPETMVHYEKTQSKYHEPQVIPGGFIFDYRSQDAWMAMTPLGWLWPVLPILFAFANWGQSLDPIPWYYNVPAAGFILLSGLAATYPRLCHWKTRIRLDDSGITQFSLVRTIRIPWSEVEACEQVPWLLIIRGRNGTIRLSNCLGSVGLLRDEVLRRARPGVIYKEWTNVTNS